MNRLSSVSAFIVLMSIISTTRGQDAPSVGIFYNVTETSSISYRCSTSKGVLSCDFTQTSVRPKATIADLPETIDKARKGFASEKPPSAEDCGFAREVLDILEGRKSAPNTDAVTGMSEVSKKDMRAFITATINYCASPNEETYLNVSRTSAQKDRRTCKVSSNDFRQSFTQAEGSLRGPSTWVVQSKPEGSCGVVQLSRIEPEVLKIGTRTFVNWKYIARKAITNPSAELATGLKCSGLDERTYVYDWRAKEHQLTCDYVEFSPF